MRCVYPSKLLGLVDVTQSMGTLSNSARVEVARSCHTLLTGSKPLADLPWDHVKMLKNAVKQDKQAIIYLKDQVLQVVCDNVTITEHKLNTVSALIHVAQVPGVVVFVGTCRMINQRRAVVFNLGSLDMATTFVSTCKEIKQGSSNSCITPTMPPTADRPLPQPPQLNRPLPQLPTDRPLPTPPTETIGQSMPRQGGPSFVTPPGYGKRLPPTPPETTAQGLQRPERPSPVTPPGYERPLPDTPTTANVPPEQNHEPPSNVRHGYERPLPTYPYSQPQQNNHNYEKIPIYENPDAAQPSPPALPLRYENVQELKMRSRAEVDHAREFDVDDWSEEGGNIYENASQYYNTLGFNQEEFEQLYMTQSEREEIKHEEPSLQYENQPSMNTENQPSLNSETQPAKVEVEEAIPEPLPEPTLEEDIQSFLKDEFKFKNTIWRIREAKPSLSFDLRSLLQGTETMADIHNDMYIAIYEGYRSASRIAEVFLARTDQLQRYKFFLSNSPKIKRLIQEQPNMVKKKFPKFESDIQLSWKRLNFYLRSLESMLATAPPKDQPPLQAVVNLLRELNREGDSGMMMEAVRGTPFNLTDYAPLLLHSSFGIRTVSLQDMKSACHVLLFPKILVLTATKDDGYEYLRHLPLTQLKILPSKQERSFVLETQDGERFGLRAASEEKSQLWLHRLNDLLG